MNIFKNSRKMKTVILICTQFEQEKCIPTIKKEIAKYVGERLIQDNPTDAPILTLNGLLEDADKAKISEITSNINDSAAVFMIECEDEFGNAKGNLCTLVPKIDDFFAK